MADRTKTELRQDIASLLADNTTGEISAADLRAVAENIVDSYGESDLTESDVNALIATAVDARGYDTPANRNAAIETVRAALQGSIDAIRQITVAERTKLGHISVTQNIDLDNLPTGGASDLDGLSDVDTSTTAPTDGQVLIYDDTDDTWKPGAAPSGGGGGVSESRVRELADAEIQTDVEAYARTGTNGTVPDSRLGNIPANKLTNPAAWGVPTGGTAGQVLTKVDGADYNLEWADATGGSPDPTPTPETLPAWFASRADATWPGGADRTGWVQIDLPAGAYDDEDVTLNLADGERVMFFCPADRWPSAVVAKVGQIETPVQLSEGDDTRAFTPPGGASTQYRVAYTPAGSGAVTFHLAVRRAA